MTAPVITIIIPSFNQAAFLDETLTSVFAQNYPALDVRVIDGGSTDGSRAIIERWAPRLAHWESERDRGQTHAINKGLAGMRGAIWMYLNSDDLLAPGALAQVAAVFADPQVQWLSGVGEVFAGTRVLSRQVPEVAQSRAEYLRPWARRGRHLFPFSGACFLRREIYEHCGAFDETFHYSMDMEYYTRLVLQHDVMQTFTSAVLGRWRWHEASKTHTIGTSYGFLSDEIRIAERYLSHLPPDEQALVRADLRDQRRWLAVARAMHRRVDDRRGRVLGRILAEAMRQPRLLVFRPWLGALRQTLTARHA